ncbi:MAG: DUF1223 domain-containing protein [Hyphomicrobiaceae bacterium]|nr:DUF1223 domain-containing protein [Hyphomicrobiaceae bacterium]
MRLHSATVLAGTILFGTVLAGLGASSSVAQEKRQAAGAPSQITTVLELFTSQGCSSCPPADALMHSYAGRKDVIALSLPVDYWDYLGWKDTLANPKFSARQRYYAKERGDGRVYTPQMVVNGRAHVNGSSAAAIDEAIIGTRAEMAREHVPVQVRMDGHHILIETGEAPTGSPHREATIWLVTLHKETEVKIERGENRGKTVKYYNVVRDMSPIGMWSGKAGKLELSRDAVAEPGNELCAVILQIGKAGPIVGAAVSGL